MPTAEKAQVIEETKERYGRAAGVFFTEYRGLKVKELQKLRKDLRDKGGEIHVVKNTLFRAAAGEDAGQFPEELSSGPTAVAFVYENEADCAKVLVDFGKGHKNLVVKGGFLAGKLYDAKQVEALSKLPPRDVLISQVIGAIAAPLSNLVGVIEALYATPIRTIGAVADKMNEGAAPAPAAKAAEPAPEPETTVVAEAAPAAEETSEEATAESPEEPSVEEAPAESELPAEEPTEETQE